MIRARSVAAVRPRLRVLKAKNTGGRAKRVSCRPSSCIGGAWPTGRRPVLGVDETRNLAGFAMERAWWSRLSPSGEPEPGHLVVAHQQDVADQHRVVPDLVLYPRRPARSVNPVDIASTGTKSPFVPPNVYSRSERSGTIGQESGLAGRSRPLAAVDSDQTTR